jgi:CIC family chloride channel protein
MKKFTTEVRIPALALFVGSVSTLAGIALLNLIWLITNLAFHGQVSCRETVADFTTWGSCTIFVPMLGGLLIGLIARFGSPDVRGHGIPEAMQGVITNQSRISVKLALLKPPSTALSIGTGGPFGAEGPIIATGGAVGSLIGQWFPTSAAERKILLAAGAAAGMTAVFGTPLAGVLLALELLLFEFRSRSLIPVALAAGIAMALRSQFHEPYPMLPLPMTASPTPALALVAIVIGLATGALGVGITHALHAIEHGYEKLPLHWMWHPTIGGLAVGCISALDPRILGPGYDQLREMLGGGIPFVSLLNLGLLKFFAWSLCLGSRTAGGTLAPIMTIGGAAGGLIAFALYRFPMFGEIPFGIAVLVGMAAIFASVSRAFLTSVAFAFEATHCASAFGPLLLGCGIAIFISRMLMRESMMTENLARHGIHAPSDFEPDPLHGLKVASVMLTDPLTLPPSMTIGTLANLITCEQPRWNTARLFPIIDENQRLLGIISRAEVLSAMHLDPTSNILDIGIEHPIVTHPDMSLTEAADLMVSHGVGRLPVVTPDSSRRLVGLLTRREIFQARQHRITSEQPQKIIRPATPS